MKRVLAVMIVLSGAIAPSAYLRAEEPRIDNPPPPVEEAGYERGDVMYVRHCAVCHGIDGRGDGPLAQAMKLTPSDLTQISVRHKGEFPSAKIADVIRNGGGVLGHGNSAMLPWGQYFSVKKQPEVSRTRIKGLADYLQSLQKN